MAKNINSINNKKEIMIPRVILTDMRINGRGKKEKEQTYQKYNTKDRSEEKGHEGEGHSLPPYIRPEKANRDHPHSTRGPPTPLLHPSPISPPLLHSSSLVSFSSSVTPRVSPLHAPQELDVKAKDNKSDRNNKNVLHASSFSSSLPSSFSLTPHSILPLPLASKENISPFSLASESFKVLNMGYGLTEGSVVPPQRKKHLPVLVVLASGASLTQIKNIFKEITPFVIQTKVDVLKLKNMFREKKVVPSSVEDPRLVRLTLPPHDKKCVFIVVMGTRVKSREGGGVYVCRCRFFFLFIFYYYYYFFFFFVLSFIYFQWTLLFRSSTR
jgi:hypothetical protein